MKRAVCIAPLLLHAACVVVEDDTIRGAPCDSGEADCLKFEWGTWKGGVDGTVASGEGVQTFTKSGDEYKGTVAGGKRNGQGVYAFANGDGYSGAFRDDQRVGWGQFFYKEQGMFWEGPWEEGKQHTGIDGDANAVNGFIFTAAASGGVFRGAWSAGVQDPEVKLARATFKEIAEAKGRFEGGGGSASDLASGAGEGGGGDGEEGAPAKAKPEVAAPAAAQAPAADEELEVKEEL